MFIIQIYGVNGIFLIYHIKEVLFAYNGKLRTFINKADDKNVSLKSLNLSDVKLLIQCEVRVFIELDVVAAQETSSRRTLSYQTGDYLL